MKKLNRLFFVASMHDNILDEAVLKVLETLCPNMQSIADEYN